MPMNPNFLCCIGAELKNSTQQTTRMSQVYLYRSFEDETLSDMLSAGFFNAAMGIIRQDDLLLLYSPNETTAKYTYARVSSVSSSGVVIEQIGIDATQIIVDTTGYSNLSGNNLQEILNNLDTTITTINDTFVRKDGTSIMSAPLKFIAGSFRGAVGPYLNGVEFYNVGSDGALGSAIARLTSTNGLTPNTDNVLDIGSATKRFKDLYIARVITGVINNGYDIAVPATAQPETLALKSEVDLAANSGRMITDEGVWFAKMYAASTVPTGAEYDGKNYADFSQVDGDNNPVIKIYTGASGAWTLTETITPPADYDGYVPITSKIWDIIDQTGQQGGRVLWNHQTKTFTPYPQIISFENIDVTGESTVAMPVSSVPGQIVNKQYVDNLLGSAFANRDLSNLTGTGANISNWSSNVSNCITEIPQDIKLELSSGTLTLKAGSKAYVPNGAGVFDTYTASSDIILDNAQVAGTGSWVVAMTSNSGIFVKLLANCVSGAGATTTAGYAYDTTTNNIGWYNAGGVLSGSNCSFPIAIIHTTSGTVDRIDQVFNGIGYIGSTLFVSPNVKGLNPQGLNADGTLNNTTVTISSVMTRTLTAAATDVTLVVDNNNLQTVALKVFDDTPNVSGATWCYSIKQNKLGVYTPSDQSWSQTGKIIVGTVNAKTGGVITSLNQKTPFHAVDYNDASVDFVVQSQLPTSANNYTWYRKYKSGWVEQGGVLPAGTAGNVNITLPVAMKDTNYAWSVGISYLNDSYVTFKQASIWSLTTTGFTIYRDNAVNKSWKIEGLAA